MGYDVPVFTETGTCATVSYAASVAATTPPGADTSFFAKSNNNRGYAWDPATASNIGTYTVTIIGSSECATDHVVTYTVKI